MLTISVNLNSQVYKDQNKATFTNITSKKIKQEALKKEKDNAINSKYEDINVLKKFEGIWSSEDTVYLTIFNHNNITNELEVYTFSFKRDDPVKEKIIKIKDNMIKTRTTNPWNGWEVTTDYKMLDDNVMLAKFDGDTDVRVMFYKADLILNHPSLNF